MTRIPLTQQIHHILSDSLKEGMNVIDATAGNGHDTLFLASQIGNTGHVYAFDIQQEAIEKSYNRLQEAGLLKRVTLIHAGHELMHEHIPSSLHGNIGLIMFNLGYLPSANKSIITRTTTTLKALECSIQLLESGGTISILAYPGHIGGQEETDAVKTWAENLPDNLFNTTIHLPEHRNGTSPEWIEIKSI